MPSLGADMETGTLVEWLKKPGEAVHRGDVVAVVDTQKGAIEIEIFETGIIDQILVQPGQQVPVGTPLARLRTDGAAAQEPEPGPPAPPPEAPPAPGEVPPAPETPPGEPPPEIVPPPEEPGVEIPEPEAAALGWTRASPAARRRAMALRLDLGAIAGTGPDGSITLADVEAAARATPRPRPRPPNGRAGRASIRPRCARRSPPPWHGPSARSRTTI